MEYIESPDLKICCEMVGNGDPIVLIMGLTASMNWWDRELVDALARQYSVLIFDNRGAGRTVTLSDREFTCELFADDTIALMDAKGIRRASILGMSMGGLIAQELAIKYPDRVNNLVLCCTFCGGKHMINASDEVLKMLMDRSGGLNGAFERLLNLMFTQNFLNASQDYVKNFKQRYLRAPINAFNAVRQFMACMKSDTYERLSEIKNPTLVATGTDDLLIPPQNSTILASRVPGAKLIEYEGCGHGFISQAHNDFLKDLFDFLMSQKDPDRD